MFDEEANQLTTVTATGAIEYGQITISHNMSLTENKFYMFYVSDSERLIARTKIFITNQPLDTFKMAEGLYTTASASDNTYVTA